MALVCVSTAPVGHAGAAVTQAPRRDRWGRPLILLPDGSREVAYRRASDYGAALESAYLLERWKRRQTARGIARRADLALEVTRAEIGLQRGAEEASAAKKELDALVERAMDVVESGAKASIGTALHDVMERVDRGEDPGHVPEQWRADVDAYRELTAGFEVLDTERFVVCDRHEAAGTLDRTVRLSTALVAPDGSVLPAGAVVVGDLKTAQDMHYAGAKFAVQCWVYATGLPYDPVTRARQPWGHDTPRDDWALIFSVPSGQGRATLHWVDLRQAGAAADVASQVYAWRAEGRKMIVAHPVVEHFPTTAAQCGSVAELTVAYARASAAGAWDDELRGVFSARKSELADA
jgi:hypothetical protein